MSELEDLDRARGLLARGRSRAALEALPEWAHSDPEGLALWARIQARLPGPVPAAPGPGALDREVWAHRLARAAITLRAGRDPLGALEVLSPEGDAPRSELPGPLEELSREILAEALLRFGARRMALELFAEAQLELPLRLAFLAGCPPEATAQEAPLGLEIELRQALAEADQSELRRILRELEAESRDDPEVAALVDLARRLVGAEAVAPTPLWVPEVFHWPFLNDLGAGLAAALRRLGKRVPFDQLGPPARQGGSALRISQRVEWLREQGVEVSRLRVPPSELAGWIQPGTVLLAEVEVAEAGLRWALLEPGANPQEVRLGFPRDGDLKSLPWPEFHRIHAPSGASVLLVYPHQSPPAALAREELSLAFELERQALSHADRFEFQRAVEKLQAARQGLERVYSSDDLLAELEVLRSLSQKSGRGDPSAVLASLDRVWSEHDFVLLHQARFLIQSQDPEGAYQLLKRGSRRPFSSPDLWTELGDLEEERGDRLAAARAWRMALAKDPLFTRAREQLVRHFRRQGRRQLAYLLVQSARETHPKNPYNLEMAGLLTQELGLGKEVAQDLFERAIELEASRPYAYGFLCDLLQEAGQLDQALEILERGMAASPDSYPFLLRAAEICFDHGRYEEAEERAKQAFELRPDQASPVSMIGACRARQGDLEEALPLLKRAVDLAPEDPWPRREMSIHLRVSGHPEKALEVLEEGLAKVPEDVGILAQMALCHEVLGDLDEAFRVAREALEISGPEHLEMVRLVARLAKLQGKSAAAEAIWRTAQAHAPEPGRIQKEYLSFLLDTESFDLALGEAEALMRQGVEDEEILAWYGYSLVRTRRFSEAVPWLKRALEIARDFGFARSVLLDALTELGEDQQALDCYRQHRGRLTPLGYECAFVAAARQSAFAEALGVCRKAILVLPRSAGFFHRRAADLLLQEMGDAKEALGEAQEAVRLDPENPRSHMSFGKALAAAKRFEEAESAMDRMVETGASFEDLLRFRFYLAEWRGDWEGEEGAARGLARLLKSDPSAELYWLREAALASLFRDPQGRALEATFAGRTLSALDWGYLAMRASAFRSLAPVAQRCLERAGREGGKDATWARINLAFESLDREWILSALDSLEDLDPRDHRLGEVRLFLALLESDPIPEEVQEGYRQGLETGGRSCPTYLALGVMRDIREGKRQGLEDRLQSALDLSRGESATWIRPLLSWVKGDPVRAERELQELVHHDQMTRLGWGLLEKLSPILGLELPSGRPRTELT